MNDVVEVFMNSIQQPEEKFLGVVLGVTLELKGALRHHILRHTGETCRVSRGPLLNQRRFLQGIEYHSFGPCHCPFIKYSARLTGIVDDQHIPNSQQGRG